MLRIAIDGPSGAGKSTVAKLVAKHYNILYLDTGAMYRAIGLLALRKNKDVHNAEQIEEILQDANIRVAYENGSQIMYLDDENVNGLIRTEEVSMAASAVSAVPAVRLKLVELQRDVAENQDVILDGRDIGTYVLPNAEYKFFLVASPEERAKRRTRELIKRGQEAQYDTVLKQIIKRDHDDSTRSFAPLKQADDAVLIDSTDLNVDEVLKIITDTIDGDKNAF